MLFQFPFCICWDKFCKEWKQLSLPKGWWLKVESRRRCCWRACLPWHARFWDRAREASQAYEACWNGIWQAPQNGPLTWGQFVGWEGRYLRSSRRLPLVCVPAVDASHAPCLMKCGCTVPSWWSYKSLLRNTCLAMTAPISHFLSWLLKGAAQKPQQKKKKILLTKNWIDEF